MEKIFLWFLSAGLSSEIGLVIAAIFVVETVIPIVVAMTVHFAVKFT